MVLKLCGRADVPADREVVWQALHDPCCLRICIPGCRHVERVSPTRYDLSVRVGLGLIAVAVGGTVQIHDSHEPRVLCLKAAGSGGMAGLVAGELRMMISETVTGCRIDYVAEIEPKGAFAAIGTELMAFRARRLVDQFVATFVTTVGGSSFVARATTDIFKPIEPGAK